MKNREIIENYRQSMIRDGIISESTELLSQAQIELVLGKEEEWTGEYVLIPIWIKRGEKFFKKKTKFYYNVKLL